MKRVAQALLALILACMWVGAAAAAPPFIPPGAPTQFATPAQASAQATGIMKGDSLTSGNQDTLGGSIAKFLALNYGLPFVNAGIQGQTSSQICARTGDCPLTVTVSGNSIAASGQTGITAFNGVAIVGMATNAAAVQPLSTQGGNTFTAMHGMLCGIAGTMTRSGSGGPPSTSEFYNFTPDLTQSSAVACAANSTWTPDLAQFIGSPQGIWLGQNNLTNPTQILADYATVIGHITTNNYFVLDNIPSDISTQYLGTTINNNIQTINSTLASTYGPHYVGTASGGLLSYLLTLGNAGNALDVFDVSQGIPPSSLRAIDAVGTLSAAITSTSQTTISATVTSGPGLTANTIFKVDSEYIQCAVAAGSSASSCIRGYANSTPATHSSGAAFVATDWVHYSSAGYSIIADYIMRFAPAWYPERAAATNPLSVGQAFGQILRDQKCSAYTNTNFFGGAAPFAGDGCGLYVGYQAGLSAAAPAPGVAVGEDNLYVGDHAGQNCTGANWNTFVGEFAGCSIPGITAGGSLNTGTGAFSLRSIGLGAGNTATGALSLMSLANSYNATADGYNSFPIATVGYNTGMGANVGAKCTTCTQNTVMGQSVASTTLTTGVGNILIGTSSAIDTISSATNNEVNIGGLIEYNVSTGITVTSGLGTGPVVSGLGTQFFLITAGTGTPTTTTVLGLPPAANDWFCRANDKTAGTVAAETASTTTSSTQQWSVAPSAGDVIKVSCVGR